jgi:hypothetical protein
MRDPYRTGISKITGKLVTIRHATGRDLIEIREYLQRHHAGCIQKDAEVVAAVENDRLIGFGIVQRIGGDERVVVRDLHKGSRLGPLIVGHIREYARASAGGS